MTIKGQLETIINRCAQACQTRDPSLMDSKLATTDAAVIRLFNSRIAAALVANTYDTHLKHDEMIASMGMDALGLYHVMFDDGAL